MGVIRSLRNTVSGSIRWKITVLGAVALLATSAFIIGYAAISVHSVALENAQAKQVTTAESATAGFSSDTIRSLSTVQSLADALAGIKSSGTDITRDTPTQMLKSVFQANPHFIQIYSTWEPNAFDGKDREFEGVAPYDSNGRYETDWFRDDAGTITEYVYNEDESVDYSADWYLSAKDAGSAVLLEPYLDEIEGEQVLMTSVIAPVNVGGRFLGVVGADIAMDFLQSKVDALPENSGSMMVMVTPEGEIAAATRRPDLVGTQFTGLIPDEAISQTVEQSGGTHVYKTPLGDTSITQVPVLIGSGEKPWTIAVLTPEEEITRDANALILQLIAVASMMIAIGLILLFTASRRITTPLGYLITGMKRLADGDKNVQIPVISQDEIGKVSTEFNNLIRILVNREQKLSEHAQAQQDLNEAIIMTAESVKMGNLESALDEELFDEEFRKLAAGINELIAWIRTPIREAMRVSERYSSGDFSARFNASIRVEGEFATFRDSIAGIGEQVGEAIEVIQDEMRTLSSMAGSVLGKTQSVTEDTHLLADRSDMISTRTEQIAAAMGEVIVSMDQIALVTSQIAEKSAKVAEVSSEGSVAAESGQQLAVEAREAMKAVQSSVHDTSMIIGGIADQMAQITSISRKIQDLTEQTNLLSLNASIEAARAGQAGAGFAVVAGEVKGLAMNAEQAAAEIQDITSKLEAEIKKALSIEKTLVRQSGEQGAAFGDAVDAFNRVIKSIQKISGGISQIASSAEAQAGTAQEVKGRIHEVDGYIRKAAEACHDSAGATSRANSATEEIASHMIELNRAVDGISDQISHFSA